MRFIGSKAHLLSFIETAVRKHCSGDMSSFGDLFCGTAVVSRHFKKLGYQVVANDNLTFCTILAKAVLLVNDEPTFQRLTDSKEIQSPSPDRLIPQPYDCVLSYLNHLSGVRGFIYSEYSPGGTANKAFYRKYFTDENAQKIDAIREKIAEWEKKDLLSDGERVLLIADLMKASNRVANIAGTYGYFMRKWSDARVFKSLKLQRSAIVRSKKQHKVYQEDANSLIKQMDSHILYLDPPYTWRHYGAYYHILETIARWDRPKVEGMSGLRPWEDSKSRYCYRDQAADALSELISQARAGHIFVSYNSEGLITHEEILGILSGRGKPTFYEKEYRRYKSNQGGIRKRGVEERLYYVEAR
jgi:adenine-specific DNA-methyltransferase